MRGEKEGAHLESLSASSTSAFSQHSEKENGTFSAPQNISFIFMLGKKNPCDLLVHLKPIKDLLALIKWHHFKG